MSLPVNQHKETIKQISSGTSMDLVNATVMCNNTVDLCETAIKKIAENNQSRNYGYFLWEPSKDSFTSGFIFNNSLQNNINKVFGEIKNISVDDNYKIVENARLAFQDEKNNTAFTLLYLKSPNNLQTCLFWQTDPSVQKTHTSEGNIYIYLSHIFQKVVSHSHHLKNQHLVERITDTIPSVITVLDITKMTTIFRNRNIGKVLGYADNEIKEMGDEIIQKIIKPVDLDQFTDFISRFQNAKDGELVETEYRLKHKNNSYRTFHARGTVFHRDQNNQPSQIIFIAHDITDKKMYEQALLQSNHDSMENQARLAEAQQLAHLGSWDWDLNNGNVRWSDEMYRIFEHNPGEQVTMDDYMNYVHPSDMRLVETNLTDLKEELKPCVFEHRVLLKNKTLKWVQTTCKVVFNRDKRISKITGASFDITRLKNAYTELSKTENLYRTLARYIPDSAVMLLDRDLKIQLADGSVWNEEKFPKSKMINRHVSEYLTKAIADEYIPLYKKVLEGETLEFETQQGDKYFKVNLLPVKNEHEQIFACLSVSHEITKLKTYQKDLEEKINDLNRSNRELEQFAYVASHDLQEPLRKIRAFGDRLSLKFKTALGEDGLNYISRMENASERMQTLIDDLLAFSRLTRNKDSFVKISIEELVQEILNDLEYSIEKNNARITTKNLPEIDAVPSQMRQLFQNLISNGLKFSKPDESPIIKITGKIVYGRELDHGQASITKNAKYAVLEVSDKGIGFDEQYKEKIFQIFQRLHSRSEYEGTGIGLAVCKRIAENHQGYITAESKPGKGSTFIIVLPVHQKTKDGND